MDKNEDKLLLQQVSGGNKRAFDTMFKKYYQQLVRYAIGYMSEGAEAEELVQDVFVNLWEQAPNLKIEVSVLGYLYTSVRNKALNAIKHEKVKQKYADQKLSESRGNRENERVVDYRYFRQQLMMALAFLPGRCREIFELAKFEGLTYGEIADYMEVSVKTVENQMGIAMKKLRGTLLPLMNKIYES